MHIAIKTRCFIYVMFCAIWYHLYNLKSVKNTFGTKSTRTFIYFPFIYFEIFLLKIDNGPIFLYYSCKRFKNFGPKWEIVSVPYLTDLTFMKFKKLFIISRLNRYKFIFFAALSHLFNYFLMEIPII